MHAIKKFLLPTKTKFVIFIILVVYTVLGVFFAFSMFCRGFCPPPNSPFEVGAALLFLPVLFLGFLLIGVASLHTTTTETSLIEMLRGSGVGLVGETPTSPYHDIVTSSTPTVFGYVLGTVAILIILYILSTAIAYVLKYLRTRTR